MIRRLEAVGWLLTARLALATLPYRHLAWWLNRPSRRRQLTGAERNRTRAEVVDAIRATFPVLPGDTDCFPRALAAHGMLRRRGIATTVYYGARRVPGRGLVSHVWVRDGDLDVVGNYAMDDYQVLASYPEEAPDGGSFVD